MEEKICKSCSRPFEPISFEHELCYNCWLSDYQKYLKSTGKPICPKCKKRLVNISEDHYYLCKPCAEKKLFGK
jgi:DNA-directed RNA polymerase subunit RPC12/RpoP